jgi:hypothetical protein
MLISGAFAQGLTHAAGARIHGDIRHPDDVHYVPAPLVSCFDEATDFCLHRTGCWSAMAVLEICASGLHMHVPA